MILSNKKMKTHKWPYVAWGALIIIENIIIFSCNVHYKRQVEGYSSMRKIAVYNCVWVCLSALVVLLSITYSFWIMH
jgi:hypothetical protein